MELVSQDYVRVVARWIQVACAVWGSQATATVLLGGECCLGEELVELGYLDVLCVQFGPEIGDRFFQYQDGFIGAIPVAVRWAPLA